MDIWLADNAGADLWVIDDPAGGVREVRNSHGQLLSNLPVKASVEEEFAAYKPGLRIARPRLGYARRHPRVYRYVSVNQIDILGQWAYSDAWRLSRTSLQNLCA